MSQLDPNLASFIIAHRVQMLSECDQILPLEGGRAVASGGYGDIVYTMPSSEETGAPNERENVPKAKPW